MNKEQLSEAIGGVGEALLDEAMSFEGTRTRRGRSRGAIVAACVAAALAVGAAAAGIANGWRVRTLPADEYELGLPASYSVDNLLVGDLEVGAYPLSEEVQNRIREKGYGFSEPSEEYVSVREVEEDYGIRLLRMGGDERNISVSAGEFDPSVRPEGGIMVSGSWISQMAGWGASEYFWLCTTAVAADEVGGGIITGIGGLEDQREYYIQSLGVTAQVFLTSYGIEMQPVEDLDIDEEERAFIEGIDTDYTVYVFFEKDDIAYSMGFFVPIQEQIYGLTYDYPALSELVDWVCEKLETLHY